MAGARLEKVGTIFARTSALLRKNVLPVDEKPIWYDLYALHPPQDEPRFDRMPKKIELREILYEEDLIRAKLHTKVTRLGISNLTNSKFESKTQKFIHLYNHLKSQGALDDDKIFEVALEQLNNSADTKQEEVLALPDDTTTPDLQLSTNFALALHEMKHTKSQKNEQSEKKPEAKNAINVKSLF